ncbi:MAG: hypothetical protein ACXWLC_11820 [Rhizomicrobium sp.]
MNQHKKKKRSARTTVLAFSALTIVAGAAIVVYNIKSVDRAPATTASIARNDPGIGFVLVPDGNGTCNKFSIGNDSGKGSYEGTVPCDSSRPKDSRSNLPPALRGMQDSLRR